jgi:uncharacterized membrane protein
MKKYFISGVVFLLPIAITLAIINFTIEILTTPFQSFFKQILYFFGVAEHCLPAQVTNLIILTDLIIFTFVVGLIVRSYLSRKIIHLGEYMIARVPLIGTIYKASQDVIHTLISSPGSSFKQVVLVPFPNEKSHCLGLLVKDSPKACNDILGKEMLSVFVPTTPNPTTGFIVMFSKESVQFTDISVEDALKYIISCGMITPENAPKNIEIPKATL